MMTSRRGHDHLTTKRRQMVLAAKLRRTVLRWFETSARDFPWRKTKDPFHILIAEILLRQTQAARVSGPFRALITRYPTPNDLARANVAELREWFTPLGLVQRADHLVAGAQALLRDHNGQVPNDPHMLQALPGIGEYASNAILCLAFRARLPMIDEGSGRVLRRVLGFSRTGPAYKDRRLATAARSILPQRAVREFNLGLIDLAASHCHPVRPNCQECPLRKVCHEAKQTSRVGRQRRLHQPSPLTRTGIEKPCSMCN